MITGGGDVAGGVNIPTDRYLLRKGARSCYYIGGKKSHRAFLIVYEKVGASTMINSNLLAVVESTLADTASGNWQKPLVMFVCNILALLVISRRIWYPHVGPKMPLPFPSLFNNVSVPAFLACMSAGHLLGVFAILTLHLDKYV